MHKRALASILCIIFMISGLLFGCTSNPTTASSTTASSTTAGSGETTTQESTGSLQITWDDSDISWKKKTEPVTLTLFIDYTWWPMDTWGKDEVSKAITEKTGVNVDVTKATTGDGGELQVMLAGGSLPDMVYFARADMDGLFQNPDVSYAYDDLIMQYCPELMNLIDPIQLYLNKASDGKIYSIKSHYFSDADWADPRNVAGPGSGGFHYRQDIYEAIGSPDMSSIEGIESAFAKVKENYPDMIAYLPMWRTFNIFYGATSGLVKVDDKITLGVTQPEYLDYAKFMNRQIANGFLPKEGLTYTYEQFLQALRSGKVFSASYNTLLSDEENNFIEANDMTGKWVPYLQVPTVNGEKKAKTLYQSIGWSSLYISKTCKDPERAILFYEYLKSPEGDRTAQFGVEGEHWNARTDGYIDRTEKFLTLSVSEAGVGPGYGLWCFGASGLNESILNSSVALSNPKFNSALDLQKVILTYVDRDPLMYFAVPKGGTDTYDKYGKMNQLITDSETNILLAANEADAVKAYEDMITKLNDLGLPEIERYMTDEYNKAATGYEAFIASMG